ncbi:tyrosine-type recombinase/integrase [Acidithiobacillus ferrivorans]|nr:tyrosine-type recombinase/integrase [Acidithiobacillus ferrivorans]
MALTDRAIQHLKPKDKRYDVSDGTNYGGGNLMIRVQPSGSRYFVYRTKVAGKDRQITIGKYPSVSLSEARIKAAEYGEQRADGIDPALTPAFELEQMTIQSLTHEFMERWSKPRKKSWRQDERILNRDVLPKLGSILLTDFRRAHLRPVLEEKVSADTPMSANMILSIVRKMLNWAVDNDYLAANPLSGMTQPHKPQSKDRVLSANEIKVLWREYTDPDLRERIAVTTAMALRMILVTAQRPGEVVGMEWPELDGDWWNLPAERAKNGLAHRIPLNRLALDILERMAGIRCSTAVFPSTRYAPLLGRHMNPNTLGFAISRQMVFTPIPWFTPHDLRRTAASHMASMGTQPLVISRLLNHKEGGITQIYNRYSYDVEKREAMDKWADRITEMVGSDE